MEQEEDGSDLSQGDQTEVDNEETFEDLDVELDELLWDMERLNEVDQDLDEDDESPVTTNNQTVSTEVQKA